MSWFLGNKRNFEKVVELDRHFEFDGLIEKIFFLFLSTIS